MTIANRMTTLQPSTIQEILKVAERPDVISFAGGLPAPELFPVEAVREAAQAALGQFGSAALQYGASDGRNGLREAIAAEMARRGRRCGADDILVTTGSQQCLDLMGKVFLEPGATVLTENPTYLAAIQAFQMFEVRFEPVPTDEEGIIPSALPELVKKYRPRFLYTIPTFQNPTGKTLGLQRRKELVETAAALDLLIVEDDPYGRLRYRGEDLPPLTALDGGAHTVYVSTFSKTVAPGLRTGWIVASGELRKRLIIAKQAADLHTSSFDQVILERYLADNDNGAHVRRICSAYGERCAAMEAALSGSFGPEFTWTHPDGGMFLWVAGPDGMDALDLLPLAIERKVAFVPGRDFFPRSEGANCFRLNFSNASPERIAEGIRNLALLFEERGLMKK